MVSLFTSESVCAGHPDKICDQISDAVVDEALRGDPYSHVAVESLAAHNQLVMAGEVTSGVSLDFESIARKQIRRLGYDKDSYNFSDRSPISLHIHNQSREIAVGVENTKAGDQGMMFGYACKETPELMPLPIILAHRLTRAIDTARESGVLSYLRPDGKSQVTVQYKNGVPTRVTKVVVAVPHKETISIERVKRDIISRVVIPTLEAYGFTISDSDVILNGTGIWHSGGPSSDSGLTGRKIVVDTYGGYARVGGGCFSGKDPTKVDRTGAYGARYIAKNIVAHGLADRAEVSLAYVIGQGRPVMQEIETFGTGKVSRRALTNFVNKLLDTSVSGIIETLNLRRPLYLATASYGHFGRDSFPWEQIRRDI